MSGLAAPIHDLVQLAAAHERAWRANWDASHQARLAVRVRHAEWVEAETAYNACQETLRRKWSYRWESKAVNGCACGEHWAPLEAAYEAFERAKADVLAAVEVFKAGVTPEQLEAQL